MFLKKYLNNLFFPPFCCDCYEPLGKLKLFCAECQDELGQSFTSANPFFDEHYGWVLPVFQSSSQSRTLMTLMKNPQNIFLVSALSALYCLKLIHYSPCDINDIYLPQRLFTIFLHQKIEKKIASFLNMSRKKNTSEMLQLVVASSLSSFKISKDKRERRLILCGST